jgi:four helix bundle protein
MAKSYRDLLVWSEGMALTKAVYLLTEKLPKDERFGLTSQMRRASVSIPSNIAEGHGKNAGGFFSLHLGHARASLFELETQLQLCADIGFLTQDDIAPLLAQSTRLAKMLNRLITVQTET